MLSSCSRFCTSATRVSNTVMQLYVIRHAIAEDPQPGRDDADRELTEPGKTKLRRVVRGLRALDVELAQVLTSPKKRAAQTAKLLEPIASSPPIATELLAEPPRTELLALIAEGKVTTGVVGHEPWLGELVSWLAFGDPRHGDALVIKKSGVVWLDGTVAPGGMQIRAVMPPRLLRTLR
jgi:phosphohistidine phosphatase